MKIGDLGVTRLLSRNNAQGVEQELCKMTCLSLLGQGNSDLNLMIFSFLDFAPSPVVPRLRAEDSAFTQLIFSHHIPLTNSAIL